MSYGILSGVLWALDTVILGIALQKSPFINQSTAIELAPFVSTFLHDFISSLCMLIFTMLKKDWHGLKCAFSSKSGKFIMLGAILAGPIGMSGYVNAIKYMGPAYTAIVSSMFPALGALFAWIFLKERMKAHQIIGLICSILGVLALSYTPVDVNSVQNLGLGFLYGLLCCVGWASEAVIVAYGFKDASIKDEEALTIRQMTSALAYGCILLPLVHGFSLTKQVMSQQTIVYIACAALSGTFSYLFYYKAISRSGAIKSMALNITYSAWAILFGWLLLGTVPSFQAVLCGVVVVIGSILAANDEIAIFDKK